VPPVAEDFGFERGGFLARESDPVRASAFSYSDDLPVR
jgi:hypothetical protein